MKTKVSEATGCILDWLVAKAKGYLDDPSSWLFEVKTSKKLRFFHPSTDWGIGGSIIEQEELYVNPTGDAAKWKSYQWLNVNGGGFTREQYGPTPLIAAMRCFVASKLGNEVEIPEQLLP